MTSTLIVSLLLGGAALATSVFGVVTQIRDRGRSIRKQESPTSPSLSPVSSWMRRSGIVSPLRRLRSMLISVSLPSAGGKSSSTMSSPSL